METSNISDTLQGPIANDCNFHWGMEYTIPNANISTSSFLASNMLGISIRVDSLAVYRDLQES